MRRDKHMSAQREYTQREWDPEWTGTEYPPWHITEEEKIASLRPRYLQDAPSLIDRLMPYILIVGFIGFCYGCVWIGYLLMGVAD